MDAMGSIFPSERFPDPIIIGYGFALHGEQDVNMTILSIKGKYTVVFLKMGSFNSRHYSVPVSVTPILPSLLLSFSFFFSPVSPIYFSLLASHRQTHKRTPPSSSLFLLFSKVFVTSFFRIAFFFLKFLFQGIHAFEVNNHNVLKETKYNSDSCNLDRFQQGCV